MHPRTVIQLLASLAALASLAGVAEAKPKIAVLGLEVIDDGTMDAQTTSTGKLFTDKLRLEASRPASPYELAPNSRKDLLEMKLLSNCSDEARPCMAQIGKELGAERLMYGKIERRKDGYHIALKLLNTGTREMERVSEVAVPFREQTPDRIGKYASLAYKKMMGQPLEGSVLVRVSNADKGTVYIDGQIKGSLAAGSAKILGVTEGARSLSVEAAGFDRHDRQIMVTASEELAVDVALTARGQGRGGGGRPGGTSRALFWTSATLTVASGAGWTVMGLRVIDKENDKERIIDPSSNRLSEAEHMFKNQERFRISDTKFDACGAAREALTTAEHMNSEGFAALKSACDDGKSAALITNVLIGTSVVAAAAATWFYYKGYVAPKSSGAERTAGKGESDKARVRVDPAIGPGLVGAGLTVEF
jgi:hypothetical protein